MPHEVIDPALAQGWIARQLHLEHYHSEGLMRPTSSSRCFASIAISTLMISASPTHAQTPTGSRWWPSEWGPDDQRGAANRLTPEKVIEAVGLI